ncbi:Putative major facilitator superfamily, MFS transporter superfamily [Septoria linicola]|uniref:Major facilitator superfamily, MFS transporter superfamily n=1 Tax=Septoria linicola TaxID=215465 RepID=A0A9Q9ARF2_9PEZI|nr:Putative major facilitator superfamily, MFS transporter superfamily [Septoria linicola]
MDHSHREELEYEEQSPSRPTPQCKRTQRLVLLGSAILQLPIWGFAMTFGIFQEAYTRSPQFSPSISSTSGIIGMTTNGVMYLLMPLLFTAFDRGPWSCYRRRVASIGVCLSSGAFLLSSWSTQLWHLLLTQGVMAALGNTLVYSPSTLYLDEWFGSGGRATAYGAILASKNVVGSGRPLLFSKMLETLGFAWTLRIWSLIVLVTGFLGLSLLPSRHSSSASSSFRLPARRRQSIPWTFFRHRTFYIYSLANTTFSSGYGLPQTYLSSYARETLHLSTLSSSLMITLFNAPGIISCLGFGFLSDRYPHNFSAATNTSISAFGSAACTLLLWGLASNRIPAVLICFSLFYGFFAGGYSSTWGGWIKELEAEAERFGEEINTGMLYGLLNGARGVGYVVSGVAGVELLKSGGLGQEHQGERWGYGTRYGGLILFTGVSCVVGGWSIVWRRRKVQSTTS